MSTFKNIIRVLCCFISCVTSSSSLNCDLFRECDCDDAADNLFELSCPKKNHAIKMKAFNNATVTIKCLSDANFTYFPRVDVTIDVLALETCAEKPYFLELSKLLPIGDFGAVALTGTTTTTALYNIESPTSDEIIGPSTKELIVHFYKFDKKLLTKATGLQTFTATSCSVTLRPDFFNKSTSLRNINLSRNKISALPHELFWPTKYVEQIDLSYNNLVLLLGNPFRALLYLRRLNLEGNHLTVLQQEMLESAINLKELNLKNNNIRYIESNALYVHMLYGNVNVINLSYNNLTLWETTGIVYSPFSDIYREPHNLQLLDLRNNKILDFLSEWMHHQCADVLDVRYNNISKINLVTLQNIYSLEKILNLDEDVDLYTSTSSALTKYNNTIFLKGNPVATDGKLNHLTRYYDYIKSSSDGVFRRALDLNNLNCHGGTDEQQPYVCDLNDDIELCPESCSCSVRPWEAIFVVDCANRGLRNVPKLMVPDFFNVEINLDSNFLTLAPQLTDGYGNVIHLSLSHNDILEDVTWIPPRIEVFKIDDNNIHALDEKVISTIQDANNLRHISLDHNPWICDCKTSQLVDLLKTLQPIGKVATDEIICEHSVTKVTDLNFDELCKVYTKLTIIIVCVVLGMMVAIVASVCYKYKEEIQILLSVHDLFIRFTTLRNVHENKINDAFICYTRADEHFLIDDLLPILEGGLGQYKIGLHLRDWLVGEFIMTQITKSIEDSRRTVVILSPNFLKSKWGMIEFRLAHEMAMQGLTRVIVIVYEEVNFEEIPDKALKKYITTKSYIKWKDRKFWSKLKSALPNAPDPRVMSYKHLLRREETSTENEKLTS